jgi:hypothetical protein
MAETRNYVKNVPNSMTPVFRKDNDHLVPVAETWQSIPETRCEHRQIEPYNSLLEGLFREPFLQELFELLPAQLINRIFGLLEFRLFGLLTGLS